MDKVYNIRQMCIQMANLELAQKNTNKFNNKSLFYKGYLKRKIHDE